MAIELAIYYTPIHFLWGVKSGATPDTVSNQYLSNNCMVLDLIYLNNALRNYEVNHKVAWFILVKRDLKHVAVSKLLTI